MVQNMQIIIRVENNSAQILSLQFSSIILQHYNHLQWQSHVVTRGIKCYPCFFFKRKNWEDSRFACNCESPVSYSEPLLSFPPFSLLSQNFNLPLSEHQSSPFLSPLLELQSSYPTPTRHSPWPRISDNHSITFASLLSSCVAAV